MHSEFPDAVASVTAELFQAYGLSVQPSPHREECTLAGVIGFVGDGLRGNIVLATVAAVSAASRPVAAQNEVELQDWIGELANQLLGRVKNRFFLARGIDIQLSAPVTVAGRALSCEFGADKAVSAVPPIAFTSASGPVLVWTDLHLDEGVEQRTKQPAEACAAEGALEWF